MIGGTVLCRLWALSGGCHVDGIYSRRTGAESLKMWLFRVAIAVNEDGYREVLGAAEA